MNNATQSVIENCYCSSPSHTDVDNIFLTHETHWATIRNCFIYGGNGIHNDEGNNGVCIENNYINYCNKAIYYQGNDGAIIHNDVEGYNQIPYYITGNKNNIECFGERNKKPSENNIPAWIYLHGSYNTVYVCMYSDGGNYYNPLFDLAGSYNDITINNCSGYRLFYADAIDDSASYNKIKIIAAKTLLNNVLLPVNTLSKNSNSIELLESDEEVLVDESTLINYITDDTSKYEYNATTHTYKLLTSDRLHFDFSSILDTTKQAYIYYVAGSGNTSHGWLRISQANSSVVINDQIAVLSPSSNTWIVYTNAAAATAQFTVKTFRLMQVLSNKLIQ